MMTVRLLSDRSGIGLVQYAGQIINVERDEGLRMVQGGIAEAIKETATNARRETTVAIHSKGRRP